MVLHQVLPLQDLVYPEFVALSSFPRPSDYTVQVLVVQSLPVVVVPVFHGGQLEYIDFVEALIFLFVLLPDYIVLVLVL
jgi:hypothetical protein